MSAVCPRCGGLDGAHGLIHNRHGNGGGSNKPCPASSDRVMGTDSARVVGRFAPGGPTGYRAATAPDSPVRATRDEAVEDERQWAARHDAEVSR